MTAAVGWSASRRDGKQAHLVALDAEGHRAYRVRDAARSETHKMTNKKAKLEATARWGYRGFTVRALGEPSPYRVGYKDPPFKIGLGSGQTWEEAFAKADKYGGLYQLLWKILAKKADKTQDV